MVDIQVDTDCDARVASSHCTSREQIRLRRTLTVQRKNMEDCMEVAQKNQAQYDVTDGRLGAACKGFNLNC